jgi:hypothetical protein
MGSSRVIVRRSTNYSGDRKASSYLIEGTNGLRFAKCSIMDAEVLPAAKAKTILKNMKRKDIHRNDSSYELVEID